VIIVGNKKDLEGKRVVGEEEASEFAGRFGFKYKECSAKSGDSVEEVFQELAMMMKEKIIDVATTTMEESVKLVSNTRTELTKRCCSNQ
jgi:GTPase SAR1 family protein